MKIICQMPSTDPRAVKYFDQDGRQVADAREAKTYRSWKDAESALAALPDDAVAVRVTEK